MVKKCQRARHVHKLELSSSFSAFHEYVRPSENSSRKTESSLINGNELMCVGAVRLTNKYINCAESKNRATFAS